MRSRRKKERKKEGREEGKIGRKKTDGLNKLTIYIFINFVFIISFAKKYFLIKSKRLNILSF